MTDDDWYRLCHEADANPVDSDASRRLALAFVTTEFSAEQGELMNHVALVFDARVSIDERPRILCWAVEHTDRCPGAIGRFRFVWPSAVGADEVLDE